MNAEENTINLDDTLRKYGFKVTPQRVYILKALFSLKDHPSAEQITELVHQTNPGIATATVYKTLDSFVKRGLISKFRTEGEAARYDTVVTPHHHLLDRDNDRIEDYQNEDLNLLLHDFFREHNIPNFEIESIKLQISGRFK